MKLSGFTFIEVILMVALMIFIGIIASPFYGNFLFGQEAKKTSAELRESFTKARSYSMMGKGNDQWGVALDAERIVLFKGGSFGGRDPVFDEVYPLHDLVTVTGLSEVVFERGTGAPSSQPTITITFYGNSDTPTTHTHTLTINAAGVVDETP